MNPVGSGSGDDLFSFNEVLSRWESDYRLVSAALENNDAAEVKNLLARGAFFSDATLVASLWNKFPNLAIEYLDKYPQFAPLCPHAVLVQQQDNTALITRLFDLGMQITEKEYVDFSIRYPKIVATVLKKLPHLAQLCPASVYEQLEAWPQTEPVRKVVARSGAKTERDDAPNQDVPDDFFESFKRARVRGAEDSSDEELPDVQGFNGQ